MTGLQIQCPGGNIYSLPDLGIRTSVANCDRPSVDSVVGFDGKMQRRHDRCPLVGIAMPDTGLALAPGFRTRSPPSIGGTKYGDSAPKPEPYRRQASELFAAEHHERLAHLLREA